MTNFDLNAILNAFAGIQEDTLKEFTEGTPSKEEIQSEVKKSTSFKWTLIDGAISIGTMLLNQKRQKEFENLEKSSEHEAETILKDRQARLDNLKDNLGVSAIEQKLEAQDKVLNDIKAILGQLQSAADQLKKDKTNKVKDLHPAEKISKKKEVEDDDDWT